MIRIVAFVILLFSLACQDETPVQPNLDASPRSLLSADGQGQAPTPKLVPLKGEGAWEWDGTILAPGERCLNAGGVAEAHFTATMHFTHLGRTEDYIVQCYDFSMSPPQVFTLETLTASNGDQLVLFEAAIPLDPVPDGYNWGYPFVVEGGTGRFAGAIGEGIAYGTTEATSSGLRGMEVIEGSVSSMGSIRGN